MRQIFLLKTLNSQDSNGLTPGGMVHGRRKDADGLEAGDGFFPFSPWNIPEGQRSVFILSCLRRFLYMDTHSCRSQGFRRCWRMTMRLSAERWAKICIERSPSGEVNVVSVVTGGYSDDANNELLAAPEAWLRITRRNNLAGLHYSLDGREWRFARTFRFGVSADKPILAGIHVQSPYGKGCNAVFSELIFSRHTVENFKSGE